MFDGALKLSKSGFDFLLLWFELLLCKGLFDMFDLLGEVSYFKLVKTPFKIVGFKIKGTFARKLNNINKFELR